MKFAIIGSGNVGSAIARAVTDAGHDAVVADPSEEGLRALADGVQEARGGRHPRPRRPRPLRAVS